MVTPEEKAFFNAHGYLHVPGVLAGADLAHMQAEFDRVWELEQPRVNQHALLKYESFVKLIEHAPILQRHRAIFGAQVQLLQYDLLRQGPFHEGAVRNWHRDFTFPGDRCLAINTIITLEDMTDDRGPTRVIPGSQRGERVPNEQERHTVLPGEVAVPAKPGDAVFINGAIWHTGGINKTAGLRRGIFMYYGYWWLKRYNAERSLPWQAFAGASEQRLRLLGIKMPDSDLHMYHPDPEA